VIDHGQEYRVCSQHIVPVSTIGAGDNFNAGMLYGLYTGGISRDKLDSLTRQDWDRLVGYGIEFGTEVCMSTSNYVSTDFAKRYKIDR
jgi:fructokinase